MKDIALALIIFGSLVVVTGMVLLFSDRLPWLGHLPGDIHLHGRKWSFSFPLATCVLVSAVLTLLVNITSRFFRG